MKNKISNETTITTLSTLRRPGLYLAAALLTLACLPAFAEG